MTARQIAKDGQARIDNLILEMVKEYGLDKMEMRTVETAMQDEIGKALYELHTFGRILTNAERWGK